MKKIKRFFRKLFSAKRKRKLLLQNKYFAMVEMEKDLQKAWLEDVVDNMHPDAKLLDEMNKHPFKEWVENVATYQNGLAKVEYMQNKPSVKK